MSKEYTDIHISPVLADWPSQLQSVIPDSERLMSLRTSARKRLVEGAEKFVMRLTAIADEADLPDISSPLLTGDPEKQPIVLTGHQPVVFHSGLTFKYEVTEQFAADNNAVGIAVAIDTDRGDAGQFSYPEPTSDKHDFSAVLAIESLADSHNIYSHGKLKSAAEIRDISTLLVERLTKFGQTEAAGFCQTILELFCRLRSATSSAMEANLIARWNAGIGNRLLELPLSAVASFPEVLTLTADILKQPHRFAAAYNSSLDVFRQENNIRNAANPFPNLKTAGETCELPFWVINHNTGQRQVLEVKLDGNVTHLIAGGSVIDTFAGNITAEALEPMLLQNLQIVPRGALITAFLRLLFSDLFVHGTGGARYDAFTDEFIRSWWNAEPPPYTVASASRYLFPAERAEIQRLEGIQSSLRDLQFNPQRYLGSGIFSDALESRLQSLLKQKNAAVGKLKTARSEGVSGKKAGTAIQDITNRIREEVNAEFEPQLSKLSKTNPEQLDAINCRTYPWFFFG